MQLSLRTRLTVLLLAAAIIPVLAVGMVAVQRSSSIQIEQAIAAQNEIANRVAIQVLNYINLPKNQLEQLIKVREIQKLPREDLLAVFNDLMSFSNIYNEIILSDRFGNIIARASRSAITTSGETLENVRGRSEFETPLASGEVFYGEIAFDKETGEPYMYLSLPVTDLASGEIRSVLIAQLRFKLVWSLMSDASTGGQSVYLVDSNNRVIAHSNPSLVLQRKSFEHPEKGVRGTGLLGADSILGVSAVNINPENDFFVVAELPSGSALALSYNLMLIVGLTLGVSLVTAIGFSLWQTRQITRPIEELVQAASKISSGELSARVQLASDDEIGALGKSFNQMAAELQNTLTSLEHRVAERTQELENQSVELELRSMQLMESNINIQKRATQFETIAAVMRSVASVQNLDALLEQITELISARFGFYHVGIFLNDTANDYAVLSASNSEGGKHMLARGHKLKIGQVGIVGNVVSTGKPRIALDTGSDAVFFQNPDLPETRSEMALPLRTGNQIIGAIDVQSTEPNAFNNEDISVIATLADQVSVAIQNSRLFESTQKALAEADAISRQNVRQQWAKFSRTAATSGYRYNVTGSKPLQETLNSEEVVEALTSGRPQVTQKETEAVLVVPVSLRGEVIGVLNVRTPADRPWSQNELDIAQAIADRVAISVENARLFDETQRRAAKEQTIGDISAKISSSINLESVFRTTMQELGQLMPGTEIIVEFDDEDKKQTQKG
jgi:GAF domain-containing protein/HAMP domain-containing protein